MNAPKIKYDIEADVKGGASVEDLERHLRELGDVLESDLKTGANAAADAIKALGDKQAAVTNFQALQNEAGALAVELEQAQTEVRQLDAQLSKVSGTTQQFVRAELEARAALESTKAQLGAARKAYDDVQAGTVGAARKTDEYRAALNAAKGSVDALKVEVRQQGAALKEAQANAKAAQQAENALAAQYQNSSSALIQTRGALQDKNAALEAGRDKLRSMGIEAGNLAQAERNLGVAMTAVRQEALGLVPAYAKVAQASTDTARTQEKNSKSMREGLTSISTQLQNIQNIATLALGGGFATGLLKDVADTADAFSNLAARVKLSTGEGKAFEDGFARVQQVALETHSALEGTGILFSRILSAGKEFNLTQAQALGLTQSINQAVQLSGASAAGSDAAITQLIQGLQSGVLRGEEFNSVMEQAPRLARALADGLGVTTGELRKMAQAGELSTKTVITALQTQSAALQSEFTQLPATVGRAITNLQTQWMLFVGGLDSSTGATSYVAQGINAIAANLDNIARVAGLAGAALTASLAVQGAAALRAYAAEAALAAGATNLLSASIAKVPKTVNIVVAVTGFEVGWQIGTMLHENSELARKLGVGMVGYFEVVINSLRLAKEAAAAVFSSDTLDAAFERYTARNRELRGQIQAMMLDAEQAPQKVGAAVDATSAQMQGLGGAAQAAGGQVAAGGAVGAAGMSSMGAAASDTLSIFKALLAEAQKPPEKQGLVAAIATQLVEARSKGLDLDDLLRRQLPEALSKLNGAELAKFRVDFAKAMQEAGASGKEMATGLRLIGEQAARSLGVDLVAAGNQVSKTFRESDEAMRQLILSLPALKEAGVDTARVVGEALSKMIDSAKNQAELDAINKRIVALRDALGQKNADGLLEQARLQAEKLKDKLDEARPGVNGLREAMKMLGVVSDESLRNTAATAKQAYDAMVASGQASARELSQGFVDAANKAIAANDGIAPAWVRAQSYVRGFRIEADDTGKSIVRSMEEAQSAVAGVGKAAQGTAPGFKAMGDAADGASKKVQGLREQERRRREEGKGGGGDANHGGGHRGGGGANPLSLSNNDPQKVQDYYSSFKPTSSQDFDKAVNASRANVSGNVALTQEYIDSQIAKMYGEQFIGDSDAEAAFNAKIKLAAYRTNYGNVVRSQQSLNEQNALLQAVQRLEEKLRARQAQELNKRTADPGADDEDAAPAPTTRRSRTTGGGGVQGGMQTGAVAGGTVVNLNYNGVQQGVVNTDANGRQALQKFMDALTQARSVAR